MDAGNGQGECALASSAGSGVSTGADKGRTLGGGGALERGHGALLERLAQLGDALSGVLAVTIIFEAAELVASQAAKGRRSVNGC